MKLFEPISAEAVKEGQMLAENPEFTRQLKRGARTVRIIKDIRGTTPRQVLHAFIALKGRANGNIRPEDAGRFRHIAEAMYGPKGFIKAVQAHGFTYGKPKPSKTSPPSERQKRIAELIETIKDQMRPEKERDEARQELSGLFDRRFGALAKKYFTAEREDVLQLCELGLTQAVTKCTRPETFTGLANRIIHARILDSVFGKTAHNQYLRRNNLHAAYNRLSETLGRTPTIEEVAGEMYRTVDYVRNNLTNTTQVNGRPLSLNAPIRPAKTRTRLDTLRTPEPEHPSGPAVQDLEEMIKTKYPNPGKSRMEIDVLRHYAAGKKMTQIATTTGLGIKQVDNALRRIKRKLGITIESPAKRLAYGIHTNALESWWLTQEEKETARALLEHISRGSTVSAASQKTGIHHNRAIHILKCVKRYGGLTPPDVPPAKPNSSKMGKNVPKPA